MMLLREFSSDKLKVENSSLPEISEGEKINKIRII
jgi:hypothetical protein